jgi:hypothetical protein
MNKDFNEMADKIKEIQNATSKTAIKMINDCFDSHDISIEMQNKLLHSHFLSQAVSFSAFTISQSNEREKQFCIFMQLLLKVLKEDDGFEIDIKNMDFNVLKGE